MKRKCSFHTAQEILADYLGIEDFIFYKRGGSKHAIPDEQIDTNDPVSFIEPPEPDPQIIEAMDDDAGFYNELLVGHPEKFENVFSYLTRRGVDQQIIRDFHIGYAPTFEGRGRRVGVGSFKLTN